MARPPRQQNPKVDTATDLDEQVERIRPGPDGSVEDASADSFPASDPPAIGGATGVADVIRKPVPAPERSQRQEQKAHRGRQSSRG